MKYSMNKYIMFINRILAILTLIGSVLAIYLLWARPYQLRWGATEQSEDWKRRSLFERQWVIRDFKKTAGMPVEEWLSTLERLGENLHHEGAMTPPPLEKLAGYYEHLAELAKGYEKNAVKLEENLRHVYRWRNEVKELEEIL
jgi:hypothetical protein